LIVILLLLAVSIFISLVKKSTVSASGLTTDLTKINLDLSKIDPLIRSEFSSNREENQKNAKESRQELQASLKDFSEQQSKTMNNLVSNQRLQLETFSNFLQTLTKNNDERFERLIKSNEEKLAENRTELANGLKSFEEKFTQNVKDFNELQRQKFTDLS